jgi:hypothetical protein
LRLSDSVLGISAARYLSTLYDVVWFFVSEKYKSNIEAILQDDDSIKIQKTNSADEAFFTAESHRNSSNTADQFYFYKDKKNYDFGFDEFSLAFYDYFDFDRKIFWEFFHCSVLGASLKNKILTENKFYKGGYVFLDPHLSDRSDLLVQKIEKKFNIFKESILFVDTKKNHYALGDKYYEVAKSVLGLPLEKYKKLIEDAWIVVLGPNELATFAINLKIKTDNCYVTDSESNLCFMNLMCSEVRPEKKQAFHKL